MKQITFPTIDLRATGKNIARLTKARGLTVRDVQHFFGFSEPQAVYKWQSGKSLPSVDNLYALSRLLEVPMEDILVPSSREHSIHAVQEQREDSRCSFFGSLCRSVRIPLYDEIILRVLLCMSLNSRLNLIFSGIFTFNLTLVQFPCIVLLSFDLGNAGR